MIKARIKRGKIRYAEGICSIVGFRYTIELEEELNRFSDLIFFCSPVSAERFFDLQGSIFIELESSPYEDQEYCSTSLSNVDTGLEVR